MTPTPRTSPTGPRCVTTVRHPGPRCVTRARHPGLRPGPRSGPHRSGFTLIELLTVVVILLILVGIGIGVGSGLLSSNRGNSTRTILSNMSAVAAEYRVQTNGPVPLDWAESVYPSAGGSRGEDPRILGDDTEDALKRHSIERFVAETIQIPNIERIYQSFADSVLTDEEAPDEPGHGFLEVRDAWGNKLIYVDRVDHDDNQDTAYDFLPERDQPYFASAGDDGRWGDYRELLRRQRGDSYDLDLAEAASDNIYSFELTD